MLIDTNQIDHLRVNFVAHFNTENDVIAASDQINSIIDNYPREMTNELRQWLNEQQTSRLTAPLATVDSSKSVDDFQDYLKELEENLQYLEENENNDVKFKVCHHHSLRREKEKRKRFFPVVTSYRKFFNKLSIDRHYLRLFLNKIDNVSNILKNVSVVYELVLKPLNNIIYHRIPMI